VDLDVLQKEIPGLPGSAESDTAISDSVADSWRMSNIRIDSEMAIPKSVDVEQTFKKPNEKMTRSQEEGVRKKEDVRAWIYREEKVERLQQEEQMKVEADWRPNFDDWDQARKEWEAGSNAGGSSWDTVKEKLQMADSSSSASAPFRTDPVNKYILKHDCDAPLRPRSLAIVRIIKDINQVTYPAGIKGPDKELNTYAKDSKFVYDREFLIQFMPVCKEIPTSPDNVSRAPSGQLSTTSRGGHIHVRLGRIARRSYGGYADS
jgi:translation initiation factor 4G